MTKELSKTIIKVSEWAESIGLLKQDPLLKSNQVHCLSEELGEFISCYYDISSSDEDIKTEFGDFYVTIIVTALQHKINPTILFEDAEGFEETLPGIVAINLLKEVGTLHQAIRKNKSVHQPLISILKEAYKHYYYDVKECIELAHKKNTSRASKIINNSLIKEEDEE